MAASLLERFWSRCSHQFSWPRRAEDGGYYQVCLRCGTRYSYDWETMRRLARLDEQAAASGRAQRVAEAANRRWQPRERRLKLRVPVDFRSPGASEWLQGTTLNISRSGLLFRTDASLAECVAPQSPVELLFEMPAEITGQQASRVLCQGTVVRTEGDAESSQLLIAAAIAGYEFQQQKVVRFWGHRVVRKRHA
jgi:hypothetical protein